MRVSVVICCFTQRRWELLSRAVSSVTAQSRPPDEVVLVVDQDSVLEGRARRAFSDVTVVFNDGPVGLAAARNRGVECSRGDLVAFLDDDAEAHPRWLEHLIGAFADPSVVGAGGSVQPAWTHRRPRWFPSEFQWVVGCSYRGLPSAARTIRNPIGANMAFRRDVIVGVGGFTNGRGRVGARPLGCEETELAIRAGQRHPGGRVAHVPEARVSHAVPPDRATWSYFRARCWSEGLSKALITREVGRQDGLASERAYAARILPQGVARGVRDALRGDASGLRRAGAIVAGLGITGAGYLRGHRMTSRRTV